MKLEKIAEIYSDENNPAVGTFLEMAKREKELAAKEKAENALMEALTPKQRKLFENFKDAWTELDTILELEAFRQGVISAEKQKSDHSLKVESGR